ncbi:MAG: M1 family peptidase, partial [Flavobacteriaceae bacterium]|nr:M1 family peptidase [Flavobacteriaceae bacterium]
MKKTFFIMFSFLLALGTMAQENDKSKYQGHTDQNKFKQMKDLLPTPNEQRTASGAPGHQYTQQKVDYVMDIRLDEKNSQIHGDEKITYHNNSKDYLEYLWLQLDQNVRAANSKTPDINSDSFNA